MNQEIKSLVRLWFGDPGQWQSKQVLGEDELCDFAEFVAEQMTPKWIPVSDGLPEIGQDVLVFQIGNNQALAAHYCEDGFKVKKYVSEGDRVLVTYWTDVTHWQPLPQPLIK